MQVNQTLSHCKRPRDLPIHNKKHILIHTHAHTCFAMPKAGCRNQPPNPNSIPYFIQISHLTLTRSLCLLWLTKPLKIWVEDALIAIYLFTSTVPRKTRVLCKSGKGISNNTRTTTAATITRQEYNLQAAAFIKQGQQALWSCSGVHLLSVPFGQAPHVAAPGSRRDCARSPGLTALWNQADVSEQKLSKCLGELWTQERQVANSKIHHRVPDMITELAHGKALVRLANSISLVVALTSHCCSATWMLVQMATET